MPDRGEEEVEEVTNPLVSIHRAVWKSLSERVASVRRQAPGARMVGEFAVKQAVKEAQRKVAPKAPAAPASAETRDSDAPAG